MPYVALVPGVAARCGAAGYRGGDAMSAMYWPDFDCNSASRAIEHADVIHLHHANERAACLEFLRFIAASVAEWHAGRRYYCIRGPGGLVRGVRR